MADVTLSMDSLRSQSVTQSLPPRGGAPRSESKSNNCQWQLHHNVKVARASPASARRMRATCLSLWERCPREGAERACLPSQSLRDSSPKVGAKGNEGNGLPHQCEHWFAMTVFYYSALQKRYRATPNSPTITDRPCRPRQKLKKIYKTIPVICVIL